MSDIIQLLPDSVANQIAAGEVIQRPASVIKELVENAIDAGATEIKVLVKDAGRTLIQVIDNGLGMTETDARMAFERHATSKICVAADLFALRTMGFRGEALASIAAIAQVELKTKTADSDLGTHIAIAGSRVEKQEAIACDTGSNFLVKNLFFNVPARRKFLKTNSTELRHIIHEFQRITLANPQVAFSLSHNDQPLMNLPAANYRQRIAGVMGRHINNHLIPVNTQATILNVHGFVGTPQGSRKTAGDQFFFVNNRYMRHPYLHKAVMDAFSNLIQQDAYPSYFIYFDIDPEMIDVNIHPTKTEIKFEDEKLVWKVLNASIRESLGKHNIVPSIDFDTEGQIDIPARVNREVSAPRVHFDPDYNPFNTEASHLRERDVTPQNWESLYQGFETDTEDADEEQGPGTILLSSRGNDSPSQESLVSNPDDHPIQDATYLQIKNRYILTPVKSGLMVIDQRRAHERILFERFLQIIQTQKSTTQQVLFAEAISFSADDAALVRDIQPDLAIFGFVIQEHQENTFTVSGVPSEFDNVNIGQLLEDLLEAYKTGEVDAAKEVKEQMAAIMARNARMKIGERLSIDQMTYLVGQLFQCSMPAYTSTGHTVFSIIENEEMEKRFK
jgi:DNA mismatch repair protein MutL